MCDPFSLTLEHRSIVLWGHWAAPLTCCNSATDCYIGYIDCNQTLLQLDLCMSVSQSFSYSEFVLGQWNVVGGLGIRACLTRNSESAGTLFMNGSHGTLAIVATSRVVKA